MLITFSCKATHNVVMFGTIAQQLIELMGCGEQLPNAIYPEDVPIARKRLEDNLHILQEKQDKAHKEAIRQALCTEDGWDDEDEEEDQDKAKPIAIAVRAFPLIEMLKEAEREKCHVMWS